MVTSDYLQYYSVKFAKIHPDYHDCVYFQSDITGRYELWRYQPGTFPEQLTNSDSFQLFDYVFLGPDELLLSGSYGGDELFKLVILDLISGSLHPVSLPYQFIPAIYSHYPCQSQKILVETNAFSDEMNLAMLNLTTLELEQLTFSTYGLIDSLVSPDGRYCITREYRLSTDSRLLLVDIPKETVVEVELDDVGGSIMDCWQADSSGFYFISNSGSEYTKGYFYDISSTKVSEVIAFPGADVTSIQTTNDGKLVFTVNNLGYEQIFVYDFENTTLISEFSTGVTQLYEVRGNNLLVKYQQPDRVAELYFYDLHLKTITQLTSMAYAQTLLAQQSYIEPTPMSVPTPDGLTINNWLYRPDGTKLPVLIYVHGGPSSQSKASYSGFFQQVCKGGWAVVDTNIRGSSGYGKAFEELINRDWGSAIVDIQAIFTHLQSLDWVDHKRIGIYGGSFGGYVALLTAGMLDPAFAINFAGTTDLIDFIQSVPPSWKSTMANWVGHPEEDAENLRKASPTHYIKDITCSILIIQGENDPRTRKEITDKFVRDLKDQGNKVDYVLLASEGHGSSDRDNSVLVRESILRFLEEI